MTQGASPTSKRPSPPGGPRSDPNRRADLRVAVLATPQAWLPRAKSLQSQPFRCYPFEVARELLLHLERLPTGVCVIDAAPDDPGAWKLLASLSQHWPQVRRVVLTRAKGLAPRTVAINRGLAQRLLIKPLRQGELAGALHEQAALYRSADWAHQLRSLADHKSLQADVSQRLMRLQRRAVIGQLAAGLAHEINNPLGTILAFSQILLREGHITHRDLEGLQLIEQGAVRIKRVVDAVVRFAHQVDIPDPKERVELAQVARKSLGLMQKKLEEAGARASITISDHSPAVLGTFHQLQQVTQALLDNSVEATQRWASAPRIEVSVFARNGRACIAVRDNGRGILQELRERIFEPFFTSKIEGEAAGMGLSTADRIAQLHGGLIEVESEPDRGSTFTLVLPLLRDEGQEVVG